MFFDTHAHYDDKAFDEDRDSLLAALPEAGVTLVIDPGCDVKSSRAAIIVDSSATTARPSLNACFTSSLILTQSFSMAYSPFSCFSFFFGSQERISQ